MKVASDRQVCALAFEHPRTDPFGRYARVPPVMTVAEKLTPSAPQKKNRTRSRKSTTDGVHARRKRESRLVSRLLSSSADRPELVRRRQTQRTPRRTRQTVTEGSFDAGPALASGGVTADDGARGGGALSRVAGARERMGIGPDPAIAARPRSARVELPHYGDYVGRRATAAAPLTLGYPT
jgi:hypothetical protein